MKRFGNLYPGICSLENIAAAHKNAKKGKGFYREVRMVDRRPAEHCMEIRDLLRGKTFRTSPYEVFKKYDPCSGKTRLIHKLPYFPDRIVHHCIVQVLEPIWMRTLIRDTFASLKKRGIHDGLKRVKNALRDEAGTRYCFKFDVAQFYPSMDHDVLKAVLRRKIKDDDVLWLLDEVINSSGANGVGVPIGNYLSQYFGNLYLSGMDHFIKERLGCRYYFRYCDDGVVLGRSKSELAGIKDEIERYLCRIKLAMKGNWQVFPVDSRGVDFLGYRFFHGYILLRKSIAKRFKKKIRNIKRQGARVKPKAAISSVMSYDGWMKHADCGTLRIVHIDSELRSELSAVCAANGIKNPMRRDT